MKGTVLGKRLRIILLRLWPPLKTRYLENELRRSRQRIRELERRPVGADEWRLAGLRAAHREVSAHKGWEARAERESPMVMDRDDWLFDDGRGSLWRLRRTGNPDLPLTIELERRQSPGKAEEHV